MNGATITSARLELYAEGAHSSNWPNGSKNISGGSKKLYVPERTWNENTISWKSFGYQEAGGVADIVMNIPKPDILIASNSNSAFQTWETYDVTNIVKGYNSDPSSNKGFMVIIDSWGGVNYASSEHNTTNLRPKLVIEYTPAGDFITIKSPEGGENFTTGDNMSISWTTDQTGDVTLSLVGGSSDFTIGEANASQETFSWIIPDAITRGTYKVAITNGSISDESETFTITPVDSCHLLIDQNLISIKSVDSEHPNEGEAVNCIDGDKSTYWHTEWSPNEPDFPHEIVFELDTTYGLSAFSYVARQGNENGRVADYEIYVSTDLNTWGDPVYAGTWTNSDTLQYVEFDSIGGNYVKFVALSEVNGNPWASAAEINLFHDVHWEGGVSTIMTSGKSSLEEALLIKNGSINFVVDGSYSLSIVTLNGRVLKSVRGTNCGLTTLSVSDLNLAKGVYVVQFETENRSVQKVLTTR